MYISIYIDVLYFTICIYRYLTLLAYLQKEKKKKKKKNIQLMWDEFC